MKLWKLSQKANSDYDTYDSAIVAAETMNNAQMIEVGGPSGADVYGSWTKPEYVTVEYIGEAKEGTPEGIILSSFNAG